MDIPQSPWQQSGILREIFINRDVYSHPIPSTGGLHQEITFKFADRAEVPGWLGIDVQSEARETMEP